MNQREFETSIADISDRYLEETLLYPRKKRRRRRRLAAAAALFFACIGLGTAILLPRLPGSPGTGGDAGLTGQRTGLGALTVIAYASTTDEKGEVLQKDNEVLSEYSLLSSSTPAMPLSFEYDCAENEVLIRVTSDKKGTMKKYNIDEEGIWTVKEQGQSLTCAPGEKIYWAPAGFKTFSGKCILTAEVTVNGFSAETKYISIRPDQSGYVAVLESKEGTETQKGVLSEVGRIGQKMGAYAPDLCVFNNSYLAFANLRGMIIYDLKKGKVASVIDLQEIDCNNFNSDSRITRTLPVDDGFLIFNENNGAPEDFYYKCTFGNGLEKPDLQRCATNEDILRQYKKYEKKNLAESDWPTIESYIERKKLTGAIFSRQSICWSDGGRKMESCLFVQYSDIKNEQIYYSILNKAAGSVSIPYITETYGVAKEKNDIIF